MVNRLKSLLRDIQSSPEYSDSAEFLLDLASKYIQRIRDAALEKGENVKEAAEEAADKSDTNTEFDKAMDKANVRSLPFDTVHTLIQLLAGNSYYICRW